MAEVLQTAWLKLLVFTPCLLGGPGCAARFIMLLLFPCFVFFVCFFVGSFLVLPLRSRTDSARSSRFLSHKHSLAVKSTRSCFGVSREAKKISKYIRGFGSISPYAWLIFPLTDKRSVRSQRRIS